MVPLQQRLDEFKRTSESGAPPCNARSEVIETMHRIGHVFIMIGAAPRRFGGCWGRGHLVPFTDRVYVEMADDASRPEISVSVSRRVRGASAVIVWKHFRKAGVSVAHFDATPTGGSVMSQHTVGIVIDKLLTDEDLRIQFVIDRMETLAELCLSGFELSPDEIDLFCRTDARLWFWAGAAQGDPQHWGARRS